MYELKLLSLNLIQSAERSNVCDLLERQTPGDLAALDFRPDRRNKPY